jgi:hypothetical protein
MFSRSGSSAMPVPSMISGISIMAGIVRRW